MARYIDADALEKAVMRPSMFDINKEDVVALIADIPTADVEEVVRCKDCKYYRAYEPPIEDFDGWCSVNENEYDKEFYCQYGKKSEEMKE
jgi:hypothetical protein